MKRRSGIRIWKKVIACMLWLFLCGQIVQVNAEETDEVNIKEENVDEEMQGENGDENTDENVKGETVPEPLENISLYATAAVLMDADSGRVLYEKNGFTPMAMASTTKIMTCIVALENADLQEEADVSSYASSMPKVKLYVQKGETYLLKDLLHSLMLESHNDSAVVIAEHIGKRYLSEELQNKSVSEFTTEESKQAVAAFAALMNQKAQEIGCEDTWFITPNGLDATETIHMPDGSDLVKEHSTTAADLARIMSYCIKNSSATDKFLEITRTQSYSFAANGRSFSCNNHNAFLNMMEGALSGKTGFTNKAGYCYVGSLKQDDRIFVVALLACGWPNNKTYKWSDTRELMEYGLEHYDYHMFSEVPVDTQQFQPVPVSGGCTDVLGETAYTVLEIVGDAEGGLLLREDEQFTVRYSVLESLEAPVEAGTEVGCVEYLLGDTVCVRIPVVTKNSVEMIDFEWCLKQILDQYLLPRMKN